MSDAEKGVRATTDHGVLDPKNVLWMGGVAVRYRDGVVDVRTASWNIRVEPCREEDAANAAVHVDRRFPGASHPVFEADDDQPARAY